MRADDDDRPEAQSKEDEAELGTKEQFINTN